MMRLPNDPPDGYGWTSIVLHWATAAAIAALLFIGSSIPSASGAPMLRLHISLGAALYLLLWLRIGWRLWWGHPRRPGSTRSLSTRAAKLIHSSILAGLGLLLLSGPPMAWTGGYPISLFGWFEIPAPIGLHPTLHQWLRTVHSWSAAALAIGISLHVAAVFKHIIINRDQVFDRMMIPAKRPELSDGEASSQACPDQRQNTPAIGIHHFATQRGPRTSEAVVDE